MKAFLRQNRTSPKKINLVAGMIRRKKATEALEMLRLMPKKAANVLYKVLHSAVHNAKNNFNQSEEQLFVTKILVGKGPTLKRGQSISRGRQHPINKRTSHITIEVGLLEEKVKAPKPQVEEKTKDDKKEVQSSEKTQKKVKKEVSKKTASQSKSVTQASKASSKKEVDQEKS